MTASLFTYYLKLTSIVLGIISIIPFSAKSQLQFQTSYGFTGGSGGSESAYSVIECADGDFVLSGYCGYSAGDAMLMRVSPNGHIIRWAKNFGGAQNDNGGPYATSWKVNAVLASDGGFLVAGMFRESFWTYPGQKMWLTKTTSTGTFSWARKLGNDLDLDGGPSYASDIGYAVKRTSDNGYISVGAVQGGPYAFPNEYQYDVLLVKLNSTGGVEWNKGFGSSNADEYGFGVVQASDGGYVIAGRTSTWEMLAIKRTSTGTASWSKKITDASGGEAYDLAAATDGGFVLMGYGGVNGYPCLTKINSTGTSTVWSKFYNITGVGSTAIANKIITTSD